MQEKRFNSSKEWTKNIIAEWFEICPILMCLFGIIAGASAVTESVNIIASGSVNGIVGHRMLKRFLLTLNAEYITENALMIKRAGFIVSLVFFLLLLVLIMVVRYVGRERFMKRMSVKNPEEERLREEYERLTLEVNRLDTMVTAQERLIYAEDMSESYSQEEYLQMHSERREAMRDLFDEE